MAWTGLLDGSGANPLSGACPAATPITKSGSNATVALFMVVSS
jgi:hypothetical protein